MRRPPTESDAAIISIAWAICGSVRLTATATLASSRLMMRAISSADLRSRSTEAELLFSVLRRLSSVPTAPPPRVPPLNGLRFDDSRFDDSRFNDLRLHDSRFRVSRFKPASPTLQSRRRELRAAPV